MENPSFASAMRTDIGVKRKQNQDAVLVRPDLGFFIVADGMGGHQGGEIASQLCVQSFEQYLEVSVDTRDDITLLYQALHVANQAIFEKALATPHLNGMGTTVSALKISRDFATILQVGDSRAYYWSKRGVWQLTRDHSLVQEKLRAGLITREQAKTDEMKNVITRSVGYEPNVKPDVYRFQIESGDGFLLCSDGLTGFVSDSLMIDILDGSGIFGLNSDEGSNQNPHLYNQALSKAAERLIAEANRLGGDDNISVALAYVL